MDFENAQGRKQRFQVSLPGSVAAESQKLFDLGITEKLQELKAKGYSLNIVAARVAN